MAVFGSFVIILTVVLEAVVALAIVAYFGFAAFAVGDTVVEWLDKHVILRIGPYESKAARRSMLINAGR